VAQAQGRHRRGQPRMNLGPQNNKMQRTSRGQIGGSPLILVLSRHQRSRKGAIVADGWLERSGQAWKIRIAVFGAVAGMTLFLLAVFAGRMVDRRFSDWVTLSAVIALPLLVLNFVLPLLVRC